MFSITAGRPFEYNVQLCCLHTLNQAIVEFLRYCKSNYLEYTTYHILDNKRNIIISANLAKYHPMDKCYGTFVRKITNNRGHRYNIYFHHKINRKILSC